MTHNCIPRATTNYTAKFADDTTVMGLIRDHHDLAYREEVEQLVGWCSKNNFILKKTKRSLSSSGRSSPAALHFFINNKAVEVVSGTKFLGVHNTDNLTWSVSTAALVKKAQQCLHILRRMGRPLLSPPILTTFYRSTIENILSMWCGSCKAPDWRNVRRVVKTEEKIIGTSLPSIQDIAPNCCMSWAGNIIRDSPPPTPWTVFRAGLWKEVLQHSVQDHKALEQLFPACHQTAEL